MTDDEDTEIIEAGKHDEDTEIIEAGKHDDASFLLELHQSIKRHAFRQRAEGSVSLPR